MVYKNPKIWGSSAWIFLHSISFSYPENPTKKDKRQFKTFFLSLENVLPCSLCCEHYKKYLQEHDIDDALQSRKNLIHYFIRLHNHINKKYNNKKKLTIKEAKNSIHNLMMSQLI